MSDCVDRGLNCGGISADFAQEKCEDLRTPSRAENTRLSAPLELSHFLTFVTDSDALLQQLVARLPRERAADESRRERPKQAGMFILERLVEGTADAAFGRRNTPSLSETIAIRRHRARPPPGAVPSATVTGC